MNDGINICCWELALVAEHFGQTIGFALGLAQPTLSELQWLDGGFWLGVVHELSVDLLPLLTIPGELCQFVFQPPGISNILLPNDCAAFDALGVVMLKSLC